MQTEKITQSCLNFRQRFVSDNNLPIQVLFSPIFENRLELLEELYHSKSLYEATMNIVNNNFNGSVDKFLEYYYEVRENVIQDILHNEDYIKFNECNLQKELNITKNNYSQRNIYNCESDNKIFVSIDLKKANFQALKFFEPNIVFNADSYEDLMKRYADIDYIVNSKYMRQVIFGKLNPSRTITVEKHIMSLIIDKLLSVIDEFKPFEFVSLTTDELIFEVKDINFDLALLKENVETLIKHSLNIEVKCTIFKLKNIEFLLSNGSTLHVFRKINLIDNSFKLMSCPSVYLPQVIKLINNQPIEDIDLYFLYEKQLAKFNGPIKLV